MRAAIYARVSSSGQREKHTIENQLRTLPAYVAAQGWTLVETFVDDGRSAKAGKLEARDGFAALQRAAAAKAFDVLVVVDVDRLTRTDDMTERAAILGPFQRAGIVIATPSSGVLDLRTMLGEVYVMFQAVIAAEENRKRAERIRAGKARAIAEGRKPAGPTPFGLAYDRRTGAWSVDEREAAVVREIFARVAGGESCVQVADDLLRRSAPSPRGPWSRDRVYRIVRSRTVVGEWCADKELGAVVRVPPVVTELAWFEAQRALLRHRRRGLVRTKHIYLLEGLATCGHCGAPIGIRSGQWVARLGKMAPPAYVCRGRKVLRTCKAKIVKCAELDDRIWSALGRELVDPRLLEALAEVGQQRAGDAHDWAADAAGYRKHLDRLEALESGWMARFRRGQVTEGALDRELAALGRERKAVRQQLVTAERALAAHQSASSRTMAAREAVARLSAALPSATPEQRRALLRELASDGAVVVTDGRVRLDLRLIRAAEGASLDEPGERRGRIGLVPQRSYRTEHGAVSTVGLRIRLVA